MSLTDKAKDKAKKNPTWLLGLLLILHLFVILLNRVPGQPNLSYLQFIAMSGMSPFQWGATRLSGGVTGIWKGYIDLRGARQENEALKNELGQLRNQLADLQSKARLSDQIEALKKAATSYPGVTARVIGHDANQWFNTVVIDSGSLAGIEKDQPVITPDGLVGRVILAGPISSQVLLISDERHGAGAAVIGQTAETRWLGILEGKSKALCDMRFLVPPDKLEPGEKVMTSGQDGLYPEGLLIGYVKGNGTLRAPVLVEIEPAAKLGKLEMVMVLKIPPSEIRGPVDDLQKEEQDKATEKKK